MPKTEARLAIQDRVGDLLKSLNGEHRLKELCRNLNYNHRNTQLSSRRWNSAAATRLVEHRQIEEPILLASGGAHDDFHIIYTRFRSNDLSKGRERLIVSQLLQDHPYALFVFSNAEQDRWHFLNVKYHEQVGRHSRVFRRIAVGGHDRLHTAAKRLAMLDLETLDQNPERVSPLSIQKAHDDAFDVEAVTATFFRGDARIGEKGYKQIFDDLQQALYKQTKDRVWAHDYAMQFLNRIMFLYFVQRKRWLGDNLEFLRAFWQSYQANGETKDAFVNRWLKVLFFEAFNCPFNARHGDLSFFPPSIREAVSRAPFLNGGLFKPNDLDEPKQHQFVVSDTIFKNAFTFFEHYNFTISEVSPLDQEVAVDAEMLGKVYESLVNVSVEANEQGDVGTFYTPRTEIDLMCRLALVDNFTNHLGRQHKHLLYAALFALEEDEKNEADKALEHAKLWPDFDAHLRQMAVLDPACGSGSFLIGMLYILNDLCVRANRQLDKEEFSFERKKRIIAENLYGVDVMKWITHVSELGLWLNLAVEAPFTLAELQGSNKPLLPHFTCKVRQGDSLVQEVGGINLGHRRNVHEIPKEITSQIKNLKLEKLKFYYSETDGQIHSEKEARKYERQLFLSVLQKRQEAIQSKIRLLRQKITGPQSHQLRLDGSAESKPYQMELQTVEWKRQIEDLETEAANIERTREATQIGDEDIFVWDVAFVEIFAGEKQGFDIVIGNPPYVRTGNIADPRLAREQVTTANKKSYKTKLMRSVYQAFPTFFEYKTATDTASRKLDGNSDLYVYFYFHALSLLNPKGSFCFITSNSWLDVGYGAELQEFLLKHCHVKMIIDNQVMRVFAQADINTVIALFSAPDESRDWGLEQMARFVMFKQPFEHVISPSIFQEIEAIAERRTTPMYKIHPMQQKALLTAGCETQSTEKTHGKNAKAVQGPLIKVERYLGDKWGGKYLRAPDIYWTIIKKGQEKLVRLGDIAEVRRGFTTGANEFFYLDEERIREWEIEEEFLKPILFSLKEIHCIEDNLASLRWSFLNCHSNINELHSKKVAKYIKWGESLGFHKRPTCASRTLWYSIGKGWKPATFVFPAKVGERMVVLKNTQRILEDKKLYGITPNTGNDIYWSSVLNSTIVRFFMDLSCRQLTGAQAIADIDVRVVEDIPIPRIDTIAIQELDEKYAIIAKRTIASHVQEEYSQPDRRVLDNVFFDALRLTQDERDAVYEAVIELVESRLKKAESLKSINRHEHENDEEMETAFAQPRQPMQKVGITRRAKAA